MKVRIVNTTGLGRNTEVTDADTGEHIPGCREANIHCVNNSPVTVELTFVIPKIDVFGIARLSEETKKGLYELRALLERIDDMEKAQRKPA